MELSKKLSLHTQDGHSVLELLPEHGGIINRLMLTNRINHHRELIAGLPDAQSIKDDKYYRGVPLYPFANRIENGRYSFDGKNYQLHINEERTNCSLHGFLMHITPEANIFFEKDDEAELTLHYRYDGSHEGYPFPANVFMRYQLHSLHGLTLTTSVENLHGESVPLSIGWHPYFTLNDKVDDLTLQLPPVLGKPVDDRLLPNGNSVPYKQFFQLSRIGAGDMDICLEVIDKDENVVSSRFLDKDGNEGMELWQATQNTRPGEAKGGYRHIQVFIHPDRHSIAIEPVTSGINAFNTKENLIMLEPGQWFTARCGVRLI